MAKLVIGQDSCQKIVQRGSVERTVCQTKKARLPPTVTERWGHLVGTFIAHADSPFGVKQYEVKIDSENYSGEPSEKTIICRSPLNMINVPLQSKVIISKNQNTLAWEIIIIVNC